MADQNNPFAGNTGLGLDLGALIMQKRREEKDRERQAERIKEAIGDMSVKQALQGFETAIQNATTAEEKQKWGEGYLSAIYADPQMTALLDSRGVKRSTFTEMLKPRERMPMSREERNRQEIDYQNKGDLLTMRKGAEFSSSTRVAPLKAEMEARELLEGKRAENKLWSEPASQSVMKESLNRDLDIMAIKQQIASGDNMVPYRNPDGEIGVKPIQDLTSEDVRLTSKQAEGETRAKKEYSAGYLPMMSTLLSKDTDIKVAIREAFKTNDNAVFGGTAGKGRFQSFLETYPEFGSETRKASVNAERDLAMRYLFDKRPEAFPIERNGHSIRREDVPELLKNSRIAGGSEDLVVPSPYYVMIVTWDLLSLEEKKNAKENL